MIVRIARLGVGRKAIARVDLFNSLTRLSERTLRYAQANRTWLPPITVVAVNETTQLPGSGFDAWAERHYALLDPITREVRVLNFKLQRAQEIKTLQNDVYQRMPEIARIFQDLLV